MRGTIIVCAVAISCGSEHSAKQPESAPAVGTGSSVRTNPVATAKPTPPPDNMVAIPGGRFYAMQTRCPADSLEDRAPVAHPDRVRGGLVEGASFRIDRTTVTSALFQQCVDAGACVPPQRPLRTKVAIVPWEQASQYCSWRGATLPTYAQWQRAIRSTDGRPFPMGFTWKPTCPHDRSIGADVDPADLEGCEYSSPDHISFTLGGKMRGEWTATKDCFFGDEMPKEILPVAVDVGFSRLNDTRLASVGGFRCARPAK